jgi:hypothetical protein
VARLVHLHGCGINALALGPDGEFWPVDDVVTSSDFQQIGTSSADAGTKGASPGATRVASRNGTDAESARVLT